MPSRFYDYSKRVVKRRVSLEPSYHYRSSCQRTLRRPRSVPRKHDPIFALVRLPTRSPPPRAADAPRAMSHDPPRRSLHDVLQNSHLKVSPVRQLLHSGAPIRSPVNDDTSESEVSPEDEALDFQQNQDALIVQHCRQWRTDRPYLSGGQECPCREALAAGTSQVRGFCISPYAASHRRHACHLRQRGLYPLPPWPTRAFPALSSLRVITLPRASPPSPPLTRLRRSPPPCFRTPLPNLCPVKNSDT